MGYRIDYLPAAGKRKADAGLMVMGAMFFLVFLLCTGLFWPEGWAVIRGSFFSGDIAVTAAAFDRLTEDLQQGIPLMEALTVFGHQIMNGNFYVVY